MRNIFFINILNYLNKKKYRIGFKISLGLTLYNRDMASRRLRVYDPIIYYFNNDNDFLLEFYHPIKRYDVVIFQKIFGSREFEMVKKLKKQGTKIVLDLNVNFFDEKSKIISDTQRTQIKKFIQEVDYVITTSVFLSEVVKKYFPVEKIMIIEENIINNGVRKEIVDKNFQRDGINLVYVGYSPKVKDILLIKDAICKLAEVYPINIYVFSEKKVNLDFNNTRIKFIHRKYNQKNIFKEICSGDVYIAPRDLSETYNLGHSFNKIGQPMSVGLPVVASPIPSYQGSPAILLDSLEAIVWKEAIVKLVENKKFYKRVSDDGIKYCQDNFLQSIIMNKYKNLFSKLCGII